MTAASNARTLAPRTSDHSVLDMVVGRLLEWMVNSVEDVRARLHRGGRPARRSLA